jgi:hypothetical protein
MGRRLSLIHLLFDLEYPPAKQWLVYEPEQRQPEKQYDCQVFTVAKEMPKAHKSAQNHTHTNNCVGQTGFDKNHESLFSITDSHIFHLLTPFLTMKGHPVSWHAYAG